MADFWATQKVLKFTAHNHTQAHTCPALPRNMDLYNYLKPQFLEKILTHTHTHTRSHLFMSWLTTAHCTSHSHLVRLVELSADISMHKRRLPNVAIADDQDFQQVLGHCFLHVRKSAAQSSNLTSGRCDLWGLQAYRLNNMSLPNLCSPVHHSVNCAVRVNQSSSFADCKEAGCRS